jgi:hypothetical protein
MKIPARYAPLVFGAILSVIMVTVVSGVVIALNQGIDRDFLWRWATSAATTWPIAFPTVTIVAPWVRRVVGRLTAA